MKGTTIGFIFWSVCGCFIIGMGIWDFYSKKPAGFWANAKAPAVNNIKKYNCAVGKLFVSYGVVFIALGLPLLCGQNSPYVIFSILGVMLETIVTMAIYTLGIAPKYNKN